tara:strand:+ start:2 stop:2806 length:2805 start_codon:yes stop_codon:yes gene_type:complete
MVTATDGDASDSVTFTVSGSELSITSAGVISFESAPDYETKDNYTATVSVSDGVLITSQDISVSINNIREGLIDYTYKITNGTDDVVPILQATVQFDDLLSVDKVIFTLRMNQPSVYHGIASFTATKTGSNTWTVDEPLSAKLNPAYSYYMNVFYESGSNGSNFTGISSRPSEGSNWKLLTASTADRISVLNIDNAARLNDTSIYLKFTNTNSNVDTASPIFQRYVSLSDSTSYIDNQSDAVVISGNDGNLNTPITISIRMLFDEKIHYARDLSYNYTPSGNSTIYNTAETTISGREVISTWTLSSTTGTYAFRPYIWVYDEALNSTRIDLDRYDFTNSITDSDYPNISSIQFDSSVGNDKEKYIDYDIQLEDPENLTRLNVNFRGPQCELIYTQFHDYNTDSSQKTIEYKGNYRLLDNQRDGIYRLSGGSLIAYDLDNNRLAIAASTLKDTLSVTPVVLDANPNQPNNLYCPEFTTLHRSFAFNEGSADSIVSYENTIQDAYGNVITPKFSLGNTDAALFNISDTGVVTFKSLPDYENPLDANGDNYYEASVRIYSTNGDSDYVAGSAHYVEDQFDISVENLTWESPSGSIIHPDWLHVLDIYEDTSEWQIVLGEDWKNVTSASISGPDQDWFSLRTISGMIFLTSLKTLSCDVKQSFNVTLNISNGTTTISEDITITLHKESGVGSSEKFMSCNNPPTSDLYWKPLNQVKWQEINDYFYQSSNYVSNGATLANDKLEQYKNAVSVNGATITYSISGLDSSRFIAAESSTGNFCDGCNHNYADYEYKPIYNLTVTANDGANSISRDVQIDIGNRNDNVTLFTSPNSYQFNGSNQKIGTITLSDKDWPFSPPAENTCNNFPCYSLSIENENDATHFYLDGNDLYFAGTPTKGDYSIKLIVDSSYPSWINGPNSIDNYNIRYATHNLSIENTGVN